MGFNKFISEKLNQKVGTMMRDAMDIMWRIAEVLFSTRTRSLLIISDSKSFPVCISSETENAEVENQ